MSKNKNDPNLLIPGENGWDIWSYNSSGASLLRKTEEVSALNIDKFPTNKPLLMAFPVKELTSLELWVPKSEEESVPDLVSFQVEKMGLGQGEENGILHQHTSVYDSPDGANALYSIDVLRIPKEGTLPEKSPNRFSVSPRCYPFESNAVTFWKEFGKWVMAISDTTGDVIHYQGFTTAVLGQDILEDIKFVIGQLLIQNIIQSKPENYIIWTEEEGIYPEGFEVFEKTFEKKVKIEQKPTPILPPSGQLLPADTRAERLESKRKKRQSIILSLLSILLLAGVGYAGYLLWDLDKKAKVAKTKAETLTAEAQFIIDHYAKWDELGPLVDSDNDPVSLLLKCTKAIPSNNVRLQRAEFTHQLSDKGTETILTINLQGEASDFAEAGKFDENLQKSQELAHLEWKNPNATQSQTGWGFNYRAEKK